MLNRRGLILGLTGLIAAPAVIRTAGLLMPVRPLGPRTWYITPAGVGDGSSPANATDIASAIARAAAGDRIDIGPGHYGDGTPYIGWLRANRDRLIIDGRSL